MLRRRSGFTLLEILIVLAIIAILSSFLLPAVLRAKVQARIALAHAQIANLKAAIVQYSSDTGHFPRRPGPLGTGDALFKNDVAYLCAALMNNRTVAVGGGPNASYLERNADLLAEANAADIDNLGFMTTNPADAFGALWLSPFPQEERDSLNDTSFQLAHLPGTPSELVFVDPWGNPYLYREWASVPSALKDGLTVRRTYQLQASFPLETVLDRPHDPSGYDLISAGPDGVLSFGAGDDISSWQGKK